MIRIFKYIYNDIKLYINKLVNRLSKNITKTTKIMNALLSIHCPLSFFILVYVGYYGLNTLLLFLSYVLITFILYLFAFKIKLVTKLDLYVINFCFILFIGLGYGINFLYIKFNDLIQAHHIEFKKEKAYKEALEMIGEENKDE